MRLFNARCLDLRIMTFLGRSDLLSAFEMLDEELGAMGVDADVFLVGGATMAVAFVRGHADRC